MGFSWPRNKCYNTFLDSPKAVPFPGFQSWSISQWLETLWLTSHMRILCRHRLENMSKWNRASLAICCRLVAGKCCYLATIGWDLGLAENSRQATVHWWDGDCQSKRKLMNSWIFHKDGIPHANQKTSTDDTKKTTSFWSSGQPSWSMMNDLGLLIGSIEALLQLQYQAIRNVRLTGSIVVRIFHLVVVLVVVVVVEEGKKLLSAGALTDTFRIPLILICGHEMSWLTRTGWNVFLGCDFYAYGDTKYLLYTWLLPYVSWISRPY